MRWPGAVLLFALAASPALGASEDSYLDRIPAQEPTQEQPSTSSKNVNYLSDALELSGSRKKLAVPLPPPAPASWENWLFLDTRDDWRLGDSLRLHYSGRLNLRTSNSIPFPTHENVRNDLRELFQLCNQARYAPVRGTSELNSVAAQFEKLLGELQNLKS